MPKEKIAIISILKPIDDTRSFHKMAISLAHTNKYEIHLYGYPSLQIPQSLDNIHFHPHQPFKHIGFGRWFARVKVLLQLLQLNPKVIVVNTPELLLVSIVNKILFGTVLLYDIQENYYFNFIQQFNYPNGIKHLLGIWVRFKERLLSPFFDHFILAEKTYLTELNFLKNRYIIIENKAIISQENLDSIKTQDEIQLVFTGTVSKSNGILRALDLLNKINQAEKVVRLSIVGHCPDKKLLKHLKSFQSEIVTLNISEKPVPYEVIELAIAQADIGLVCYELNPSNQRCMPTKVFEYTAMGLPILYESGTYWEEYIIDHEGGIGINFNTVTSEELIKKVRLLKIWKRKKIQESEWQHNEEKKFVDLFDSLIFK